MKRLDYPEIDAAFERDEHRKYLFQRCRRCGAEYQSMEDERLKNCLNCGRKIGKGRLKKIS